MAAGLGFKDFVTGEVLTAADVDGYLMQGVWVFASAAARTSAVASPQEGNMSYLKDTNSLEYYSGSAWTAVSGGGGGSLTQLGSTTTLSGASTTVSFTATGYQNLYVQVDLVNPNGATKLDVEPNSTNNLVDVVSQRAISGTNLSESAFDSYIRLVRDQIYSGDTVNSFSLLIYNVASTTQYKTFTAVGGYRDDSNRRSVETMGGIIKTTSALSALKFQGSGSGYSGGTVRVYGVN